MDRAIWIEFFNKDQFPTFPCPHCERGRVAIDNTTLKMVEPLYSSKARDHEDWEPDWSEERFSLYLRCTEGDCGEVVVVAGVAKFFEVHDVDWDLVYVLKPNSMFPPPPIIKLPKGLPQEVTRKIETAYALFWIDIGASANSLRMSLELLLDHLQVPRTTISKKTGRECELFLNGRIQYYEQNNPDHGVTFRALRVIGNLGSHELTLTREAILDAFEIYEDALSEIVGGRKAYLDAIKKKIITNKGKY